MLDVEAVIADMLVCVGVPGAPLEECAELLRSTRTSAVLRAMDELYVRCV